jgi:predicted membrane protein
VDKPPLRYLRIGAAFGVAGLVMFVGAIIGFSAHVQAVGITCLVLMVTFAAFGFIAAFIFRSQARKWRDRQRAAARGATAA